MSLLNALCVEICGSKRREVRVKFLPTAKVKFSQVKVKFCYA